MKGIPSYDEKVHTPPVVSILAGCAYTLLVSIASALIDIKARERIRIQCPVFLVREKAIVNIKEKCAVEPAAASVEEAMIATPRTQCLVQRSPYKGGLDVIALTKVVWMS